MRCAASYGGLIVGHHRGRRPPAAGICRGARRSPSASSGSIEAGEFDVCTIIYNRFRSAITQELTFRQLIPVAPGEVEDGEAAGEEVKAVYEFEPDEEAILKELLPRNLAVQIYGALVENAASEQGARMTAMDSATRNAGDMIDRLTLTYNRTRQAQITRELIEIISGAEAL